MVNLRHVDHVAIAVPDLAAAWELFGTTLGGQFITGGDDTEIGIRAMQLAFPPSMKLELLAPLDSSSYLQGYLDELGPGIHHLTIMVDDVVVADQELRELGWETTDLDLRDPKWRETYLRPRSTFGALIQLTDSREDWHTPHPHITPDEVIAGQVIWTGTEPPRHRTAEDGPPPSHATPTTPRQFGRD